jgi:hypothetical protein
MRMYVYMYVYAKMGTFAETTKADYRLSFADKENKLPFPIFRIYMY